jgi:primosomal protein N' (replication factor Y)
MGTDRSRCIARVVVERSVDREFDYTIPCDISGRVCVGSRVLVSFGRRFCHGYVVGLADHSDHPGLKPLSGVAGESPLFREPMLALARWMADYYIAPLETVLRSMLPAPVRNVKGEKQILTVRMAGEGGGAAPPSSSAAAGGVTPVQKRVLECLADKGSLSLGELLSATGVSESPIRTLASRGLVVIEPVTSRRDPNSGRTVLPTAPLPLMPQQQEALDKIRQMLDRHFATRSNDDGGSDEGAALTAVADSGRQGPSVLLLHGVTGSGKTEVYLQAIAGALSRGLTAIVLVPEIALTPQTVERFVARFGESVAVLHSHLTDGERHDEWRRIYAGKSSIVVGARSAVFAPVPRLGLIVVDEEHEPSYKQDETPRYSARDVAVMRARIEGCVVVLGSATPSLESWQNVRRGKYAFAGMPDRVDHRVMPAVRVVDMRQQSSEAGKGGYLSQELIEAIRARLERGEQCMLFQNRRGYATSLQCPKCGFVAQCDHCSVACTYHRSGEVLRCHVCGVDRPVPPVCPACKDPAFRFAGCGTQRIEDVVRKCFPKARIERLDSDVTRRRTAHEEVLDAFRAGRVDILVGTQMIAKGLHIPNVTLVGVVHADQGLTMPDFRAGERTFQLLAQVGGRAGRGDVPGEVLIQTYSPMHPAIQAARRLDFAGFSDQELAFREQLLYPPFAHLACVIVRGADEDAVRAAAGEFTGLVRASCGDAATVSDTAPAPLARAKGQYRYQTLVRGISARRIGGALRDAMARTRKRSGVTVSVDMDAVHMM